MYLPSYPISPQSGSKGSLLLAPETRNKFDFYTPCPLMYPQEYSANGNQTYMVRKAISTLGKVAC